MTPYLLSRRCLLGRLPAWAALGAVLWAPGSAHASFLAGDALDNVANILSWVVLIVVPVIFIVVFWLVHILPEKIAHKKKHPQTRAIQCLCLLSLVFGGLLWPIAWLWAYSKPVLYKLAYGTDVDESLGHHGDQPEAKAEGKNKGSSISKAALSAEADETRQLRTRIAELEKQLKLEGGQS